MLTADNAWWCAGVLAAIGAICGLVMYLGREREKPTDWDAPATDLHDIDDTEAEHWDHDRPAPVIWSNHGRPGGWPVPLPEPPPEMSTDQRRALRQLDALRAGTHPLGMLPKILPGHLPLHPDAAPADDRTAPGLRCGTCRFRVVLGYHNRSYAKCTFGQTEERPAPRISHGAATDVRAWWPACRDYQPDEATTEPGATALTHPGTRSAGPPSLGPAERPATAPEVNA